MKKLLVFASLLAAFAAKGQGSRDKGSVDSVMMREAARVDSLADSSLMATDIAVAGAAARHNQYVDSLRETFRKRFDAPADKRRDSVATAGK